MQTTTFSLGCIAVWGLLFFGCQRDYQGTNDSAGSDEENIVGAPLDVVIVNNSDVVRYLPGGIAYSWPFWPWVIDCEHSTGDNLWEGCAVQVPYCLMECTELIGQDACLPLCDLYGDNMRALSPGESVTFAWDGILYQMGSYSYKEDGMIFDCDCSTAAVPSNGRYRFSITAYLESELLCYPNCAPEEDRPEILVTEYLTLTGGTVYSSQFDIPSEESEITISIEDDTASDTSDTPGRR
jgi:hypothetical protein